MHLTGLRHIWLTVEFGLVTVGGFIVYSTGIGEIATIITAIFTGIAISLR